MTPKDFRFIVAVTLFGFLFVFFVPIIYDATLFKCADPRGLCLGDPSGLRSIGYTTFHWGGVYSFGGGGDPQLGGYGLRGSFISSNGDALSSFVTVIIFLLPLAVVNVGLLEPEVVKKFNVAAVGFVVLGLLDFVLAVGSFSLAYQGLGLIFYLLGATISFTGVVMILYLYDAGCFFRGQPP